MSTTPFHTELTLPNDADALRIARACVQEFVALAELPPEEGEALVRAAVEACANVLDHAFEPGETGTFTLAGERTPGQIVLAIRDRGIPFGATHARDDSPARLSAPDGMALIRRAVDAAEWINRGREGKELRLVKYRSHCDVTEQVGEEGLAPIAPDAPLAPEQEYTIRRFRAEDAVGVSRVIYRVYGYTYLHEDCYYPERLAQQNETGQLVSIVAVAEDGEIVGHYAIERPNFERVAERGMAVVSPAHRGRDLMGRMRTALEEEARRLGMTGVYSVAVTHHVYSQRVNESFGSRVCGMVLGGSPRTLVFKKMRTEEQPQRISWVVYFTYVAPAGQGGRPATAIVHAPPHHREMLARIYANLDAPVEFRDDAVVHGGERRPPRPAGAISHVSVTYSHSLDSGAIAVRAIGEDTDAEIRRARHDLCEVTGAEAVYLQLPLADPATPALCRAAEDAGFFFSGIGPGSSADGGDTLQLQYLHVPLDTTLIQLANPFAKELLAYVDRERARVGKPAA